MSSGKTNTIIIGIIVALLGSAEFWNLVWRTPDMITEATKEDKEVFEAKVDSNVQRQLDLLIESLPALMSSTGLMEIDSTPEQSLKHLMKLITFGDQRMSEQKAFEENELPFIRTMMAEQRGDPDFIRCGYALAKGGKPVFWVVCDGRKKKIFSGRPNRRLVNDVFYYQGDDGKAIILSALSPVIIRN